MLKIAVDVDGVVLDLADSILKCYNGITGENVKKKDLKGWNMESFVNPLHSFLIRDLMSDKDVYWNANVIPGAKKGIAYLQKRAIVYFVTAAKAGTCDVKYDWLLKNKFIISEREYIVTTEKSLVKTDVLIDDSAANIIMFNKTTVLFKQPWNWELRQDSNGLIVLKKWSGISRIYKEIIDEQKEDETFMLSHNT